MELGEAAAVDAALDSLSVSLDHLVKLVEDGGLEVFDCTQLVGFCKDSSGCGTGCRWSTIR